MIISITGHSQINVHNVVPSWAVPYFKANIRIADTLQSEFSLFDTTMFRTDTSLLKFYTSGSYFDKSEIRMYDTSTVPYPYTRIRYDLFTAYDTANVYGSLVPTKLRFVFKGKVFEYDTTGLALSSSDYLVRSGVSGERFLKFLYSDSSTTIYNKLIVTSPTDTAVSIRGGGMNVIDGSVLFSGTTGTTPASGEGSRMMWVPEKSAFRAGYTEGDFWDDVNIEFGSFAIGNSCIASSVISFSGGEYSKSNASYAFSYGQAAVSNSYNGIVFGKYNDTTISTSKTYWVFEDPLFQIGNGTNDGANNDAFRVLKNGKTYIGDSSSTTDAILVVDPTDSTVTQLGMVKRTYVLTVNDDANLVLPDDFAGWVEVSALNSGTEDEYASFRINSDGTIAGLTFNTANVTLVLGTDDNLNIGTASSKGVIENKLGGSRDFIVRIEGRLYLGM